VLRKLKAYQTSLGLRHSPARAALQGAAELPKLSRDEMEHRSGKRRARPEGERAA
jgi:hypothetical protein